MSSTSKTCRTCGRELPISEYYVHPQTADGYLNHCKTCVKARVRKHQRGNPNAIALVKKWERENPDKVIQAKEKWRLANMEKRRTHSRVARALKHGDLERGTCEVCGATKVEAHHDDYSNPLDVRWLCRQHHAELHRLPALTF